MDNNDKKLGRPPKYSEEERLRIIREKKKAYNANKKSIQIPKDLHEKIKSHCDENNLDIKDFIIEVLKKNI